ncbi:hypothetical protein GF318_02355 [Candidatus Micrarchaeota archaeon]|nr:hypothetical protein [Candidatus Micrarchaeota archaeon]
MSPKHREPDPREQEWMAQSQGRQQEILQDVFFAGRGAGRDVMQSFERRFDDNPLAMHVVGQAREEGGLNDFDRLINLMQGIPLRSMSVSISDQEDMGRSIARRMGEERFDFLSPTMQSFLQRRYFTPERLRNFAHECMDRGMSAQQFTNAMESAWSSSIAELKRDLGPAGRPSEFGGIPNEYTAPLFLSGLSELPQEDIDTMTREARQYERRRQ